MARFAVLSTGLLVLGVSLVAHAEDTQVTRAPVAQTGFAPTAHFASLPSSLRPAPRSEYAEVIQSYCVACHNDVALTGNLSLQNFDPEVAERTPETAERVIRKL